MYALWASARREEALEEDAHRELIAKMDEVTHERRRRELTSSQRYLRPQSAGANASSDRPNLPQRPLSAMKQIARAFQAQLKPLAAPPGSCQSSMDMAGNLSLDLNIAPMTVNQRPWKRHQIYMYLSDSDDDVDRPLSSKIKGIDPVEITASEWGFLHQERPASSRRLHEMSYNDPELKVSLIFA